MDWRWTFFSVDLELTNECDRACTFCPRGQIGRAKGYMHREVFQGLVDKLAEIPSRVALSGMGNPLKHPDWANYLGFARSIGLTMGLVVPVGSLNEETCDAISRASPSFLEISFPTLRPEIWPRLVPDTPMTEAFGAIEKMVGLLTGRIPMVISGLETSLNKGEGADFLEHWQKKAVRSVFNPCHTRGGNLTKPGLPLAEPIHQDSCGLFAHHAFLSWNGDLLACCHDLSGETKMGNWTAKGLKDLGQTKGDLLKQPLPWKICENCDEFRRSWPIPDRAFPESARSRSRYLKKLSRFRGYPLAKSR